VKEFEQNIYSGGELLSLSLPYAVGQLAQELYGTKYIPVENLCPYLFLMQWVSWLRNLRNIISDDRLFTCQVINLLMPATYRTILGIDHRVLKIDLEPSKRLYSGVKW